MKQDDDLRYEAPAGAASSHALVARRISRLGRGVPSTGSAGHA